MGDDGKGAADMEQAMVDHERDKAAGGGGGGLDDDGGAADLERQTQAQVGGTYAKMEDPSIVRSVDYSIQKEVKFIREVMGFADFWDAVNARGQPLTYAGAARIINGEVLILFRDLHYRYDTELNRYQLLELLFNLGQLNQVHLNSGRTQKDLAASSILGQYVVSPMHSSALFAALDNINIGWAEVWDLMIEYFSEAVIEPDLDFLDLPF